MDLDLGDRIQAMAFLMRDYEPPLVRFLASQIPAGGVFVDVGAHVGLVSLIVGARCRPGGVQIHAFEPDPRNAADLRANCALNPDLAVEVYPLAMSDRIGTAEMTRVAPTERGCAHLVRAGLGGEVATANEAPGRFEVAMTTLDSHLKTTGIDHVDVLKLDVEGFEPEALAGAADALSEQRVGCLVMEINDARLRARGTSREEMTALLAGHGYHRRPIPAVGLRRRFPKPTPADEDVAFGPERPPGR